MTIIQINSNTIILRTFVLIVNRTIDIISQQEKAPIDFDKCLFGNQPPVLTTGSRRRKLCTEFHGIILTFLLMFFMHL